MSNVKDVMPTPLQRANELLRSGAWNDSLLAYLDLWKKSPQLRNLVAGNINYLLLKAPCSALKRESVIEILGLLDKSGYKVPLKARQLFSVWGDEEKRGQRESVSKKLEPNKSTQHLVQTERCQVGQVLKDALCVDQVYVVNLSRRPDRYLRTLREMNLQGVTFKRIEAVDAKASKKTYEIWNDFKTRALTDRRKSSSHISDEVMRRYKEQLPPAVFAYLLSQAAVIQDAKKNKHRRILVLDDDVFFCTDAVERISRLQIRLLNGFKVLLLGASEYADRNSERFSAAYASGCRELYHPLPGETCGSFAMVYDESIYDELLEAIDEADGTFDNVVLGSIYRRYPSDCYVINPAVCIPDVGDSDIRPDARAQAAHSAKMDWEFVRYGTYTKPYHIVILVNRLESLRHVGSLQQRLPSEIFLSIFYKTEDGLRPVIPGHSFFPRNSSFERLDVASGKDLRDLAETLRVPRSDIVLSWPEHRVLSEEGIVVSAIKAAELRNNSGQLEGDLDGVFYCFDAGVEPKKGRHSIIIPAFRGVEDVWETVKSALSQDAEDFEVIVVNDNPGNKGFSRALRAKAEAWCEQTGIRHVVSRLIILEHQSNRNASAARNTGLLKSTGEYISFLDDDDYFEPQRLSAVERVLSAAPPDVGACYCGYSGSWNGERDMERFPEGDLGELVLLLKYSDHYMCTNTVSFRRDSLRCLGGFNEGYARHQDIELMIRFFEQFKILAVKNFLVRNRPNPVPETFTADVIKLCRLKHQLLSDMREQIVCKGEEFCRRVVEAHVHDIVKRDKNLPREVSDIVRVFLSSALSIHATGVVLSQ